jgi:TM2 domain-containing membrane protein YozV
MYYLVVNGQKTGPYTAQEIQQMLRQNAIGYETQFWKSGMPSWEAIGSHRNLFEISYAQPQQQQSYQQPQYQQQYQQQQSISTYNQQPLVIQPIIISSSKSRVAFILLGLFLGGLGIHNFYAGYSGKGITQLLLNLFLFWTIVVPIGVGIWVLIEVITVNTDSYGNRMT